MYRGVFFEAASHTKWRNLGGALGAGAWRAAPCAQRPPVTRSVRHKRAAGEENFAHMHLSPLPRIVPAGVFAEAKRTPRASSRQRGKLARPGKYRVFLKMHKKVMYMCLSRGIELGSPKKKENDGKACKPMHYAGKICI